jgi:PHS family inorganic phosphate transporter-like MFS transporter
MSHSIVDEKYVATFKRRIIFITGMGFLTDAYDLFVIGIVTVLLTPEWHLSTLQIGILNATSLLAAALGAVIFGFLADKWGRKRLYGSEVGLLCVGALMSAFATSFGWLLLTRIIIGFGIGGDYSTSAIIASEYGTSRHRGSLVLMVFAMQGIGFLIGPLFASALMTLRIPHDILWRILVGAGALPAAFVFIFRRRIQETPRFLLTQPVNDRSKSALRQFIKIETIENKAVFATQSLWTKKWMTCLLGTSASWFLFDVAFYGNSVSMTLILKTFNASGDLLNEMILSAALLLVFAIPGYFLSARFVDVIGRKFLQVLGFGMMAMTYLVIAMLTDIPKNIHSFLLIFGISYFFINFGPNATTFLISAEIYPANVRATAHGISAAIGKLGAFIGAIFMPLLLEQYGIPVVFYILSGISLLGILVTQILPEMAQQSIDSREQFSHDVSESALALKQLPLNI